ncbi:hypothetical protein IJJ08_00230 [bacterium]|nr:hypothetical protein [bacterium]
MPTPTRPRVTRTPRIASQVRRRRSWPKFIKWSWDLVWLLILLVVLGSLWLLVRFGWTVRQVQCLVNSRYRCSEPLERLAQKTLGQPMLFADLATPLESSRSGELDFDSIRYYKLVPDRAIIDFQFPLPIYQVAIAEGDWRGYTRDGRLTIVPGGEEILQVRSLDYDFNVLLSQNLTDPIIHQKLLELDYFTAGQRSTWQQVTLVSMSELQIDTPKAHYLIDLFDLDRGLQRLEQIEARDLWPQKVEIDLRFNDPVVRLPTN